MEFGPWRESRGLDFELGFGLGLVSSWSDDNGEGTGVILGFVLL